MKGTPLVSPKARNRLLIMVVAAVVVPLAVHPLAGPWTWVWAPLLLMLLALVLLMTAIGGEDPRLTSTAMTMGPPPVPDRPDERRETRSIRVRDTRMASLTEDYEFVFSADVRWRWVGEPDERLRNPERAAANVIVTKAQAEVGRYRADEVDMALHSLAARLGEAASVYNGLLEVWADDVTLGLMEEDAERLRRIADMRKENNRWEMERFVERTKRTYFAEDVFSTPGNAVIWDLVRNDADVETTMRRVGSLAHLSEAGKGKDLDDLRERLRGWDPDLASALEGIGAEEGSGLRTEGDRGPGGWYVEEEIPGTTVVREDPEETLVDLISSIEDDDKRTMTADRITRVLEQSPLAPMAPRLRERFGLPGAAGNEERSEPREDDDPPEEAGSVPPF